VFVAEDARGTGTGERLVEAAAAWLIARGMPRVMLWTAEKNGHAQQALRAARVPPHDDRDDARAAPRLSFRSVRVGRAADIR
jgi:GNAT superfamily N-acetyltransferase